MRCYTRFDLKQPNIASLLFTFVGLHEIRKRNSRDSTVVFCDLLRLIIRAFHSLFNKLIFNTNNRQLFFYTTSLKCIRCCRKRNMFAIVSYNSCGYVTDQLPHIVFILSTAYFICMPHLYSILVYDLLPGTAT